MKGTAGQATHYMHGGIQPIEEMQEILTYPEFEGFLKGNIIKYVRRAPYKGGEEDLNKARQYAYWLYLLHNNENINPSIHVYTGKEKLSKFYYQIVKGE